METFNFPYFTFSTKYPENGIRVQFGGNYTFAAEPESPPQRIFLLNFSGMQYYTDSSGQVDAGIMASRNVHTLNLFYEAHETWRSFLFQHPVFGEVVVKFNKPLEIPHGEKGGSGVVKPFDVELLEQQ